MSSRKIKWTLNFWGQKQVQSYYKKSWNKKWLDKSSRRSRSHPDQIFMEKKNISTSPSSSSSTNAISLKALFWIGHGFLLKCSIPGLSFYLYFRLFKTVNRESSIWNFKMTGFEPRTSRREVTALPTEPQPLPKWTRRFQKYVFLCRAACIFCLFWKCFLNNPLSSHPLSTQMLKMDHCVTDFKQSDWIYQLLRP